MKLAALLSFPLVIASLAALNAAEAPPRQPPRHCGPPLPEQSATNRAFTGIPSVAVAPRGRLWATWYAGVTPAEDRNNYAVLSTSGDSGATWREALTIDPDAGGPVRAFDPELGCAESTEPDSAEPKWSRPRRIGEGVMMCKPIVLSSGEWMLPVSRWKEHDESAQCVVSADAGKT